MPAPYTLDTLDAHLSHEVGVSAWHEVTQADIDAFAELTGDRQWIHVDQARAAREAPGQTTVAHGLLTLSLLPAMRAEAGAIPAGVGRAVNYGYDRIRFLAPVPPGARLRTRVVLTDARPKGGGVLVATRNTIELEGSETPALVAYALTLLFPG